MPKSYRVRTEIGVDKYVNVTLEQDWESLEILSLKILSKDIYTRFCADYGVITGRVFVNGGFGLPNSKVSVFIPLENTDELNPIISELYPYKSINDVNEEGYRYNLLPKIPSYNGHISTGSFPNKGDVLMDESYIEVYDKYYRFTVTTNESGDFMIFGVPVGEQTVFMDIDLSDIGCFSLSPQDLIQQGLATETQVNGSKFRSSSNLRELPQIKNLTYIVSVRPFWGSEDLCQIGITRVDFDLTKQSNINIQPKSIFLGSIISTTDDDALKLSCKPKNNTGNLCELISGPGKIQAIRQTIYTDTNDLPILERWDIEQDGKVIDENGTFLLNVPMNLDYVFTNEFGQQVLSNDPKKGIPTKGKYRFKFKWESQQGLQNSFLRSDFLVPNIKEYGWSTSSTDPFNSNLSSTYVYPTIVTGSTTGSTVSATPGGLISPIAFNIENYEIYINGNLYFGSPESISFVLGDTFFIVANPIDPSQNQDIQFTFIPQNLFDVYRSYAFSTDWDDYANYQEAIDCEDTFYEFGYNKVYTTAMFLDRYKNGIGRARHLGIKEIDNRDCKSDINTFPVNDIIRNFNFIFFIFNILINILTFPLLNLLFVAHLIAFMWPLLKFILIALGIYFVYDASIALYTAIDVGIEAINNAAGIISASLAGPVINVGNILEAVRAILKTFASIISATFKLGLSIVFLAATIIAALRVKGFPRIGLPMISYPECTSCDCDCKSAELDDDFDESSILQDINDAGSINQGGTEVLSTPKTLIAPVNYSGSFDIDHPNITINEDDEGPYYPFCQSLGQLIQDGLVSDLAVRASLDFRRIFSGYDVISSTSPNQYIPNPQYLLKAPQPYLFSGEKRNPGNEDNKKDLRLFAFPKSVTLSQKLNEFNTRDKYFSSSPYNPNGTGVNKIKTTVNPSLGSTSFEDQVIVILMNKGTTAQLGVGNIITFQDPRYVDPNFTSPVNRLTNLTGATTNQFQNNAITGVTTTGNTINVQVPYANPNSPTTFASQPASIFIVSPPVSDLSVFGNNNVEQSYLQYPTDIEYFQLITGVTYTDFITQSNTGLTGYFPSSYLLHDVNIGLNECGVADFTYNNVITLMPNHQNYEICIFVRGVDPHTAKQPTIQYDLSLIFGKPYTQGPIVSGSYYLNRPIQPTTGTGYKPLSHNTANNTTANLYYPSFTFTPTQSNYSGFTSNYPYYYLSTDDIISTQYNPYPTQWQTNFQSTIQQEMTFSTPFGRQLPNTLNSSYHMVGGTYIRYVNGQDPLQTMLLKTGNYNSSPSCIQDCQNQEYFNTGSTFYTGVNSDGNLTALYSPAYYRYNLTGVSFSSSVNIVMRSDRLPTSTNVQNGATGTQTGFGLHQNDNFGFFKLEGVVSYPYISAGGDLFTGENQDEGNTITGLTQTFTCEGMVPLTCYSGSGINVGVLPEGQCAVPKDRMINGCYCLLNKDNTNNNKHYYLIRGAYPDDARLFLEWKVRFTLNFAACRGIFAQVFQNNWINGVLYMFNFNKQTIFDSFGKPLYNYCEDVIIFNEISNTFFYRSSPWDGSNFIGKDSPQYFQNALGVNFPGFGYNEKQIQFPTTITDLGPRDYFINQICCTSGEDGFGSYYADQIKTTSYQDNSDIVQLGFLSRILNQGVRQRILPIGQGDNNQEGQGIIQFFNSTRGGYRIDGDWSQMLSINSEWKVSPFITENIPSNNYIYFGDNRNNNSPTSIVPEQIVPVFGLFFSSETLEERYRKIMSPGVETYNFNPLIEEKFGYPNSQNVPHYRWSIKLPTPYAGDPNIFGSEDNNWFTNTYGNGFTQKKYQDLDFVSGNEKYRTTTTELGFISNYDLLGNPQPYVTPITNILQGAPMASPLGAIVVGAPYHFYFGLNNGKTAIDRFYKLYVSTEE
jgi:hypothetical protein